MSHFIHPTAIVDSGANVGENTKIWHFSHIMTEVFIGSNCVLGQNVFVGKGVQIGNGVKIQNNVSLYEGILVEDFVFLGPSCVFTNVINPRAEIVRRIEFKKTYIRQGATIGANATILCGLEIGQYAFIAAGAVVTSDIPDYGLVMGVPAKPKGWMSRIGNNMIFDERGNFKDVDGTEYQLLNGKVSLIEE